jgi:thiosulfate/3-mercaptopyruvate sulfurtransferase
LANSASHNAIALVNTQWLEDNLNNKTVKVIFVDNWPSDKEEFEKKHIKGSFYMGIGALMGTIGNGSAAPDKAQFEGMMHRLGINNGDHVVLYGATGDRVFTLGALWLMNYFGHDKASFLDGGLAKWNKEGRPTESGMHAAEPGTYKAGSADESIRVDGAYVLKNLKNDMTVLVDARGHGEYVGDVNNDNNTRVGHIPGAKDLGYQVTNFNDDGTLKSVDELKKAYEAAGVTNDKEVITYCQGGIKAANAYYALKHILGYDNVKVYVGSWGEWANRTENPIEK